MYFRVTDEQRLVKDLLDNYEKVGKHARPVGNFSGKRNQGVEGRIRQQDDARRRGAGVQPKNQPLTLI